MPQSDRDSATPDAIRDAVLQTVARRGVNASACPSDIARELSPENWRPLMQKVRDVATALAAEGKLEITQRGKVIAPDAVIRGPVRLRLPRS